MAKIHVDGKEYEVSGAENLLQACLSLGLDIPYFCWHPALGSVGALQLPALALAMVDQVDAGEVGVLETEAVHRLAAARPRLQRLDQRPGLAPVLVRVEPVLLGHDLSPSHAAPPRRRRRR